MNLGSVAGQTKRINLIIVLIPHHAKIKIEPNIGRYIISFSLTTRTYAVEGNYVVVLKFQRKL